MPERGADKRKLRVQELREQLKRWDKHLEDQDWIERIVGSGDWKRLKELFRLESAAEFEQLDNLKRMLYNDPMVPEQVIKAREAVMLMERDKQVTENLLTFPEREVKRLEEIEQAYPKVREELTQLEKEIGGD